MTNTTIRERTATTVASENICRLCSAKINSAVMYNYTVKIACPPPYGCDTNNFINNKKVMFCEAVEVGPAAQSYDRSGQLYANRKNEEIDVNKDHYDQDEIDISLKEIKKNAETWGLGEECRIWKP
ncbi:5889_t:CDS:2 [Diversispora eburnea]|uniref:5889_t:CDS:1 n=1 Tax=Diversispora eburnea TaxID=1213867 RepID=A0A9N9BQ39_9GLOM|nr:5889_t:CDS:2 [Diversispora eburnea]